MGLFKKNKIKPASAHTTSDESRLLVDVIAKAKQLKLRSRKLTTQLFAGNSKSSLVGQGMSFKEVRQYQSGDDVRFIDWNVSARMQNTYSKVFEEERELSVFFLLDVSASNLFGTIGSDKRTVIANTCSLLAFAANNENNNVGSILFSDKIEKKFPAKKSRGYVLEMAKKFYSLKPKDSATDLSVALKYLAQVQKTKSVVFVVSDFMGPDFTKALQQVGFKHELVGIHIFDEMERTLPNVGYMELQDLETGELALVNTSDANVRKDYQMYFDRQLTSTANAFRKANGSLIQISTQDDYFSVLQAFFKSMHS